jgi:RHS repeat-associated protein
MSLALLRRRGAPVALLTYVSFVLTSLAPRSGVAQASAEPATAEPQSPTPSDSAEPAQRATVLPTTRPGETTRKSGEAERPKLSDIVEAQHLSGPGDLLKRGLGAAAGADPAAEPGADESAIAAPPASPAAATRQTLGLPSGADKTGVSSQAISVPQGSGKIQGMGESFSAQLSTGIATFTVPISLPAARGGAQPSLSLSYSSSGGHGLAGAGWSIGVPFISRQTDRGLPKYDDRADWYAEQDRFVFNGGQELVPICTVQGHQCTGAIDGEAFPSDDRFNGWQYFRPRVEGSFQRFFWSPDHKRWIVQDKSGTELELGVPANDTSYTAALETDPSKPSRIYRWNLVRQYDQHTDGANTPNRVNVVAYRYTNVDGEAYLTDIYDTPPTVSPGTAGLSAYAHHTRLLYEARPDTTFSYRRGWVTKQSQRLSTITVASKMATDAVGSRHLVRRYHLAYEPSYHVSLLASVQVEGRNADTEDKAPSEGANETIAPSSCGPGTVPSICLPPMDFKYQHVDGVRDLPGYEAFNETLHTMSASPDHSVDEELTDLFDINADGLPDILVTAPGLYGGKHGVFFNGKGGTPDSFGADTVAVQGVKPDDANTISLKNLNVSAQDLDGDGIINLLHMPMVKTYSVYTPTLVGQQWTWIGRPITTALQQSPKIDWGKDTLDLRVMDVNADGLVDVVLSTGTEFQTFFSLGRYAKGDGQFGSATWATKSSATILNDPITACVPWAGSPVRFSDPDIKLGDMNGDGLVDIVRIRKGQIIYWPGRGNGVWGTGDVSACKPGTFSQGTEIRMTDSPQYSDIDGESLRLDDVNGDGLDDLVQIRFQDVDVWLNVDGVGWTKDRHIIKNTPASPSYANRVRLVDVNGSGTRDILWGNGLKYQYIDLAGGKRPWVLTQVANGLGKTTDLEYASSTELMLAAEKAGPPFKWESVAPMPLHVVTRVTESDNLKRGTQPVAKYITEYTYRNPVYDGRQREFRGFREAVAKKIGDTNSPTSSTRSLFLLGECKDETNDGFDDCSIPERWRDNPREALKGLPYATETFDESTPRVYLNTVHNTYTLRHLYSGLDGRAVRHAFLSATDSYAYDTAKFVACKAPACDQTTAAVTGEGSVPGETAKWSLGSTAYALVQGSSTVDVFGNATAKIANGCTSGCADVDEIITTHTTPGPPTGDPTGWIWRTTASWVTGSFHPSISYKSQHFEYSALGDLEKTRVDLEGTLPLKRDNPYDGGVAPDPTGQSVDGNGIEVSYQHRDEYGNVDFEAGVNNRCREVGYDTAFAQVPLAETIYAGAAGSDASHYGYHCGGQALTTNVETFDRGLGLVTLVRDLHNEPTKAEYDPFGRLTALTRPSPYVIAGQVGLSGAQSVQIEYQLPTNWVEQPYALLHTKTQNGPDHGDAVYQEAFAYVDGMGRTVATLVDADKADGHDGGNYIAQGLTEYDNKGAARRAYLPWFTDDGPGTFKLSQTPPSAYGRQRYDAFGRQLETYNLDGSVSLRSAYHALSVDKWDAADLSAGPHQGTYASATTDGHGRTRIVTERAHEGKGISARQTITDYLPTGEIEKIARQHDNDTAGAVVRWMKYDTLGRRVLNVEPHTTKNFSPDLSTLPDAMSAWRYAYNNAGDLVGTSDARGCGANYTYDAAGRLTSEDYSPCEAHHAPYSAPQSDGTNTEVLYYYDSVPNGAKPPSADFAIEGSLYLGRLAFVADRGALTLTRYDGRGRVTGVARLLANPGAPSNSLADRYAASQWYIRKANFDGADRPVRETTGANVVAPQGSTVAMLDGAAATEDPDTHEKTPTADVASASAVVTTYTKRGTVKSVSSTYGALVDHVYRDADGLVTEIGYGDGASTTTSMSYDDRRRLHSVTTYRGVPTAWSTPLPPEDKNTRQLILQDEDYSYDEVDNPTEIHDWRTASEWPDGAKPVTRKVQYDDLYRVSQVDYQFEAGTDPWTSPFDKEVHATTSDPTKPTPAPHVGFEKRIQQQTRSYDWLGNNEKTGDDADGFYDRSLGTITKDSAHGRPYQLVGAAIATTTQTQTTDRTGKLSAKYDDAGNLTRLVVHRKGPCLPETAKCSQDFAYQWDEVGRLVDAQRWDFDSSAESDRDVTSTLFSEGTSPRSPDAHLEYAYDSGDQRVRKTAIVGADERHTLYPMASLELRRAEWNATAGTYTRNETTETPYLFGHGVRLARVAYLATGGQSTTANLHTFIELGDHLGSTSAAIDQATGELAERLTYQANGSTESDYRPGRWSDFREDYRFTGKEEDVEVGLQYFGKRFLSPQLGRWVSADPLAVHQAGSDLNLYAYVHGSVLRAVDPLGLDLLSYAKGLAVSAVDAVKATATEGLKSSVVGQVVQAAQAVGRGDLKAAGEHLAMATPPGQVLQAGKSLVDTGKSFLAVPGQIRESVHAKNDFEAGKKAFAPSATIGAAAGMVVGGVCALRGGAGPTRGAASGPAPEPPPAAPRAVPDPAPVEPLAPTAPKLLPERAGPTGKITTSEIAGKTPAEIAARAKELGLEPRGPDPAQGKGSFIDPQTGQQRILSHPNAESGPHGHVNDIEGQRVGPSGTNVSAGSAEAHIEIKKN